MIWGLVIGIVVGLLLAAIALVIVLMYADIPTYGQGYEAGKHSAEEKSAVVIRGLIEKQRVHDMAFDARKEIIRAVVDAYGNNGTESASD